MEERLQKYLASNGVASRRAAEELIKSGKVKVNGIVATLGQKIDTENDVIECCGKTVKVENRKVYVMLNKPVGYITSMNDEKGRPCVADLVEDVGIRIYPVGRLDYESEGLLLMTNDGELANMLMHPKYHKPKVYHVKIKGQVSQEKIDALSHPMIIDGYKTKPANISIVTLNENSTVLAMELFEGRNRQIRKMCEQLRLEIRSLKRISIGEIKLGDLHPGHWRFLTKSQVESLRK